MRASTDTPKLTLHPERPAWAHDELPSLTPSDVVVDGTPSAEVAAWLATPAPAPLVRLTMVRFEEGTMRVREEYAWEAVAP